jgi:hypothetical protein
MESRGCPMIAEEESGLSQREEEELIVKVQQQQQKSEALIAITAMTVKDYYVALQAEGFTEDQALKLVCATSQYILPRG